MKAPEFELPSTEGKPVRLSDYRGKMNVLLSFYVFDFSSTWTKELDELRLDAEKFKKINAQILGISADQPYSQKAFHDQLKLNFPLLSDRDMKVIRDYGLVNEKLRTAQRAYIFVGKDGQILWKHVMENPAEKLDNKTILEKITPLAQ